MNGTTFIILVTFVLWHNALLILLADFFEFVTYLELKALLS